MIESIIFGFLPFIFTITVVVFVHEMGHYLVARWYGVHVEVFSIGFGKKLYGFFDRNQTQWQVSLLPFGGYAKMADSSVDEEQPALPVLRHDQYFNNKPIWQRFAIVIAGPIYNLLFAILLLTGIFAISGVNEPVTAPIVGLVLPDTPAALSGIQEGDRLLSINKKPIDSFQDIPVVLKSVPLNQPIHIIIQRKQQSIAVHPILKTPLLGIREKLERRFVSPLEAFQVAIGQVYSLSMRFFYFLGGILTGQQSTGNLGGVLSIAAGATASASSVYSFLIYIALISVNLGVLNLLPIPLLDGGRLLFYIIEGVTRRPLSQKMQERALYIGLFIVGGLMVLGLFNDISRIGIFKNIKVLLMGP